VSCEVDSEKVLPLPIGTTMNFTLRSGHIWTMLLLQGALLSGCGTGEAASDASGDPEVDDVAEAPLASLPRPTVTRVELPTSSPDESRRHQEVEQYLARRYRGKRIVETTQTYAGDIIDWLDPDTVPGSRAEPPPRPSPESLRPAPGKELQLTELDLFPELRGPEGTIPIVRPTFERYVRGETRATSIDDFIKHDQAAGQPGGQFRLYSGIAASAVNQDAAGWFNQFSGDVEPGTFTLIELTTACRGSSPSTTMELIGIVASRDRANFGNSDLRLQVEFLSAGPSAIGNNVGGWDGNVTGFVPAAGRPYGPGVLLTGSTVNGTQYESRFEIKRSGSNWWVNHNGNWLGYYPASLFDLITTNGCESDWYGEVFDPTPTDWTWTDMGSGLLSSAGAGKAAYVRDPFYADATGVSQWPSGSISMVPVDSACYTRSTLFSSAAPWERYFYLGGPGGDATGCN
jgi:hypothetical protein